MRAIMIGSICLGVIFLMLAIEKGYSEPSYKRAITTVFWVGEAADASNDFIPNHMSFWDERWLEHFGGIDDPACRTGYYPCGFIPKENPFYVALPYAEFDVTRRTRIKESAHYVPWYKVGLNPLLKNRWVEIIHNGHTCYGQWEDVGPNGEDDFAYVFGDATEPLNSFGLQAGLDISPALSACLGIEGSSVTFWRFVEEEAVPSGPWKEVITSSGITWE